MTKENEPEFFHSGEDDPISPPREAVVVLAALWCSAPDRVV